MSIFQKAKASLAAARQPKTTIIQVERYELDKDPKKAHIIGRDLLNKDETGVPKQVKVFVNDPDGKVMGVKEYASKSSLVTTEKGGLIRLDRYIARGDDYVCRHMQRLSRDASMLRADENGAEYKTAIAEAWVKILPQMDRNTGKPQVFTTSGGGEIHRGTVFMVPKDSPVTEIKLGQGDLLKQLLAVADKAIDAAPEKTRPMLMLRDPAGGDAMEIVIPNRIERAPGQYDLRTKEEMLAVFPDLEKVASFVGADTADNAGITVEALPGCTMSLYGTTKDQRSGKPVVSRVESMSSETARMFAKPVEGQDRPEMVRGKQEYALALISYEIPKAPEAQNATLSTLGRIPGQTASPNAGKSVTENPFYKNGVATQAAQPAQAEQATPAQASAPAAQASQPAPANQAAQSAPVAAAATHRAPEEPPMPTDDDIDALLNEAEMADTDYDLDELEKQMGMANL